MYTTPPRHIVTRKMQKAIDEQQALEQANVPPANPQPPADTVKPIPSARSGSLRSTTSTVARCKQLEWEAAEAKAQIRLALIDKKLEADLAQLEAEEYRSKNGSEGSGQILDDRTRSNVEDWLDKERTEPATTHQQQAIVASTSHAQANIPTDSIQQLALVLKDMMTSSPPQRDDRLLSRLATSRDLPLFSGDCVEWLHFKSAFNESTQMCKLSDTENLWRLRKALRGDAKEAVTDLLIGNTSPSCVMEALELRFGRPELIVVNLTAQLKKLPVLPASYQHDIINFSMKINNYVATIHALKQEDYLRSPELISAALAKLPNTLIGKWTDFAYQKLSENRPKLELLAAFLKHEAEMLSLLGITQLQEQKKPTETSVPARRTDDSKNHHKRPVFATTVVDDTNKCKFCKKSDHSLPECRVFKRAMRRDRWKFVRTHGLCYCCLITRHDRNACTAPMCDMEGCGLAHHKLLHWKKPATLQVAKDAVSDTASEAGRTRPSSPSPPPPLTSAVHNTVAHVVAEREKRPSMDHVMLKVISVKLSGPNGVVYTHALLDDAASVSIIDSDLAAELGLRCEQSSAIKFIDAFGLEVYQSDAPTVSAQISGENDNNYYDIKLRQVSKLNLPAQNLSAIKDLDCKHLARVKGHVCKSRVVPRILVGEDNYFLIAPLEIIHGGRQEPYASRCRLGWSIHGYCGRTHSNVAKVFHLDHTDSGSSINELNNFVKHSFSLDSIGISTLCREYSDHLRALQVLDDTSRLIGNQWEVGLPYKEDVFAMPNSHEIASARLQSLMRKFMKDDGYADRYRKEVNRLFTDGYARELQENELSADRIWYLPHFGVQNKPGKWRVVFDAAAKVKGTSLNDFLLTGPDLYNSLMGIMLRFREHEIVIIGDIKDMFLRVKVRSQDQHVLRFLWQESPGAPVKTCVMQSLIFGATCSPFVAQYIKNKNATRYEHLYPEAAQVIVRDHYMDDCVNSTTDAANAIKLVQQISFIHKQGGFEIRGWSSNSKQVLESIPPEKLAQTAVQFKDGVMNTTERTLGLMWHPSTDTFGFRVSFNRVPKEILDGTEPPTKAKMLSVIMSVYDIHGFLVPFVIKGKIIFQDVHRSGVDWNCRIQPDENIKWVRWLEELKLLEALRIPRCYTGAGMGAWTPCYTELSHEVRPPTVVRTELHAFCDSSIKAYAAVIYWRFIRSDGQVLVCFVASKSRVTPLRPVSVPRLELQGALLAARLADTIQHEHKDVKADKRFFWTDSNTVLQWIHSDPRDYKPYVAHRLGEIDELTTTSEWRHVPSGLNAADVATREDAPPLKVEDVWFQGPKFLRELERKWPSDIKNSKQSADIICEKKQVNVLMSTDSVKDTLFPVPDEARFSSWTRLLMATARVFLFIRKCQRKQVIIDVGLLQWSEGMLFKKSQADCFSTELAWPRQKP